MTNSRGRHNHGRYCAASDKFVHTVQGGPKKSTMTNDRVIGQWRRRLECVVQQQGGYIEQLM